VAAAAAVMPLAVAEAVMGKGLLQQKTQQEQKKGQYFPLGDLMKQQAHVHEAWHITAAGRT
jgi:hypothetical protein